MKNRVDRQDEVIKNVENRVGAIEQGMQSFNTGFNEVLTRLSKLESQTCENGDTAAFQEVRIRATDFVQLQKEVKIMAIEFEKFGTDKDFLTKEELLGYFNNQTPGEQVDHRILNKVVEVKQLGRVAVHTAENGTELPKSAPFILSFNNHSDRNTFWKT